MNIDLSKLVSAGDTIAVALSGGCDSMALLHYMQTNAKKFHIKVIALNVEHGIRGEDSIADTNFVKDYCSSHSIPLVCYSVNCKEYAKEQKLSLEQAGRILRYQCFYDAISKKKCDKIATAHHLDDNVESVLFNLFRGSGIKGVLGITDNYSDKIIRPLLSVDKEQIQNYAKINEIPFVTDQTNFDTDYTRNALRLKVIPEIKKIFPQGAKSLYRFTEIAKLEDEYISEQSRKAIAQIDGGFKILLPIHKAIFARACVTILNNLGVEKDYEKKHVDSAYSLIDNKNGSSVNLPQGVVAIREYDGIVLYKGESKFFSIKMQEVDFPTDLKSGFFADSDKIPLGAEIRKREEKDLFTKFGGGTKSLGDYLTDKKVPKRIRDSLLVLADGNDVLYISGVAISDKIKVDDSTKNIIKFTQEE